MLGLLVLVIVMSLVVAPVLSGYLRQRAEITAARQQITQEQQEIDRLEQELAKWDDKDYVEQQARTRLKFVKVGEKSYTVIDPEVRDTTGSIAHSPKSTGPWYDTIWSSMQAADVPANRR